MGAQAPRCGVSERSEIVVVDGSNIATEGRSKPSLRQLNDAVVAFMAEHPDCTVTVVVDATFGHRIDPSEVAELETGVANNELVTPPAGAIGRGDAFVLSIADKVGARILSNDSFQEFQAEYPWLFDEGRLIGGKPVPHVGWVFVERLPVRGAQSRRSPRGRTPRTSTKAAGPKTTAGRERAERAEAMADGRLPPAPRQSVVVPGAATAGAGGEAQASGGRRSGGGRRGAAPQKVPEAVNELLPFLEFVEHHPVGTSVNAVVESYSSHGAYVGLDGVRGYVPLHLIGDPPPRSARKAMAIGEAVTLVVASYSPARRSIDLAFPAMVPAGDDVTSASATKPPAVKPTKASKATKATKATKAAPTRAAKASKAAKAAPTKTEKATKASNASKASKAAPTRAEQAGRATKDTDTTKAAQTRAEKAGKAKKATKATKAAPSRAARATKATEATEEASTEAGKATKAAPTRAGKAGKTTKGSQATKPARSAEAARAR